ncbi:S8/S53 family peptidase [Mesorhizobium sp. CA6]|uniref:S8/S53 family peptidase n=1 Tax=Mesorhizobium sp. CA6 TaxID=588500 RepID=UPI001CC97D0E|nr:S8/S53 family peptidase [Mesorhizobium sp. CA6]MBZ9765507.1 S8/S53 family peptidase [Mesorhizobium sp. CA6]
MALKGNGQLLVKVRNQPFAVLFSATQPFAIPGYSLEPLSTAVQTRPQFTAAAAADHWLLAKPATLVDDLAPWDTAHAAASAHNYAHYVEPDILHERSTIAPGKFDHGLNGDWPPFVDATEGISPGWHLGANFTGFESVRGLATGKGVRVAHLDTGYTPGHASKPRHLRPDLGYDYWGKNKNPIDPGERGVLDQPGHGTATLALLAGNTMDLTFGLQHFKGDIGGAPDAEVIPIRISPSVVHVYTSTMAKGLYDALGPSGDPNKPDPANRCEVVSISHGGLPTESWADAVNTLYDDGIVIVAASGDSYQLEVADIATHFTVYPSAFNRVLTAVGATFDNLPYVTDKFGRMQGCWGPETVMEKAVAGYTPNVVWMKFDDCPSGFEMDGGGTSSSTPQIAAACALWLELYRGQLPSDWTRVEACRLALFDGANDAHPNKAQMGWGILNVPKMLDRDLAAKIIAKATSGHLHQSAQDSVSFPFWRLLMGIGPPRSDEERMYEAEVAQVVLQSTNVELRRAAAEAAAGSVFSVAEQAHYRALLAREEISSPLRKKIGSP